MAKTPACNLFSLTVGELSKTAVFRPGCFGQGQLLMRNRFAVDIRADEEGVELSYLIRKMGNVIKQKVRLEWMWLRVGYGMRAYFRCPVCGKQCGKVLLNFGHWTCKQCAGACSDYENDGPFIRKTAKLEKLKRKLGVRGRQSAVFKPKGMHWKTYHRLYAKALAVYRQCSLEGLIFVGRIQKKIEKIRLE